MTTGRGMTGWIKILGANSIRLIWNLYKGFSFPVVLSFVFAIPIAIHFGNKWLQEFAYKIDISWTIIVLPLILLMIFVWVSVGFQTIRVVLANPTKNLSEE